MQHGGYPRTVGPLQQPTQPAARSRCTLRGSTAVTCADCEASVKSFSLTALGAPAGAARLSVRKGGALDGSELWALHSSA